MVHDVMHARSVNNPLKCYELCMLLTGGLKGKEVGQERKRCVYDKCNDMSDRMRGSWV